MKVKRQKQRKSTKTMKIIIIIVILLIGATGIIKILTNNQTKKIKIGNNNNSQEIIQNLLDISSYEATIDVTVYSNKNENKYKIKQIYINDKNTSQEIIEPTNIAGIKITQEGENLKIENSKLSLTNIVENYQYITDNCLDLSCFISDFKQCTENNVIEENDTIILETISQTQNKYIKYKELKIDKKTGKPLQMEIKSDSKKTTIYILYNEVKINNK